MTLGEANLELALYPESKDHLSLLKEIAELRLAEHVLYVQEHVELEKVRHEDTLFSESFFVEAEEPAVAKQEVVSKKRTVVEKVSRLAYKVLSLFQKISNALTVLMSKLGVRRQAVLKQLKTGETTFSEEDLQNLKKRLLRYSSVNEIRTGSRDETYSIIRKSQPGAGQVPLKTDCRDTALVKEIKDLLAFGIGDAILVNGDGVVISNDSPFWASVIHAYAAIGNHTTDIESLQQNLKKEQDRAAKSGILLKVKGDPQHETMMTNRTMELAKSLGVDMAGSGLNRRSSEAGSPEDAAYYQKAASFWGDLAAAVAKTNSLMDQVVKYRSACVAILETTLGMKQGAKPEPKPQDEKND